MHPTELVMLLSASGKGQDVLFSKPFLPVILWICIRSLIINLCSLYSRCHYNPLTNASVGCISSNWPPLLPSVSSLSAGHVMDVSPGTGLLSKYPDFMFPTPQDWSWIPASGDRFRDVTASLSLHLRKHERGNSAQTQLSGRTLHRLFSVQVTPSLTLDKVKLNTEKECHYCTLIKCFVCVIQNGLWIWMK